jgi:hypothetical protein
MSPDGGSIITSAFSYRFTEYPMPDGKIILRPMLYCDLEHRGRRISTLLLIDSGADFSMLRREVAEAGLNIDLSSLNPTGETRGITGVTKVSTVNVDITFSYRKLAFTETIPFQISLDPSKDPAESLLGRMPFFYRHRIDFRMGFTDDPKLGKFTIHYEEKKRPAKGYRKPAGKRRN